MTLEHLISFWDYLLKKNLAATLASSIYKTRRTSYAMILRLFPVATSHIPFSQLSALEPIQVRRQQKREARTGFSRLYEGLSRLPLCKEPSRPSEMQTGLEKEFSFLFEKPSNEQKWNKMCKYQGGFSYCIQSNSLKSQPMSVLLYNLSSESTKPSDFQPHVYSIWLNVQISLRSPYSQAKGQLTFPNS